VQSPLQGMSENEMINEARIRLAHNKQRQRLKQLLATSANGGTVVQTKDLLLACRIAKLDVGTNNAADADMFVKPDYIASRDCYGTPRAVAWKGFHKSIAYPELHPPGCFPGDLPLTRKQKQLFSDYKAQLDAEAAAKAAASEQAAAAAAKVTAASKVSDADLRKYHKMLKRSLETRFGELRRAFRLIDDDQSGDCDREELKHMLQAMFNLNIPDPVMDRMIDLADYDGDGSINFAEFARIATEDDVLNMKKTLQADLSGWGTADPVAMADEINKANLAAQRRKAQQGGHEGQGYHPKLRRTGPSLDELRRAHKTLKKAIGARYTSFREAFKSMDADGSGTLRRAELRRFLQRMVKTIPDRVISGLIDFCDDDGDTKTLSIDEFCKLLSAEYLGSGGFDPNAHLVGRRP
jgi:Ca2+-binding EF-hand superfamily protein